MLLTNNLVRQDCPTCFLEGATSHSMALITGREGPTKGVSFLGRARQGRLAKAVRTGVIHSRGQQQPGQEEMKRGQGACLAVGTRRAAPRQGWPRAARVPFLAEHPGQQVRCWSAGSQSKEPRRGCCWHWSTYAAETTCSQCCRPASSRKALHRVR